MRSHQESKEHVTRRSALKIIAGSAGAAVSLPFLNNAAAEGGKAFAQEAVLARIPLSPASFSPKFFNAEQIQTVATLSELIIPADEHSPGARAAGVYEYIDTVVGESGQREFWTQGLAAMDRAAEAEHGRKFTGCTCEEQVTLLEKISQNEEHPSTLEERFFVAFKRATIDGYYTSKIGIHKELEYQGNAAQADFEGCRHDHGTQ